MKFAFFVSSVGDTELAFSTIKALEGKGENQVVLIPLTKAVQQSVASFQSPLVVEKKTLSEILHLDIDTYPNLACTAEQLEMVVQYIQRENINQAYVGVPSVVNNEIPLQIAQAINDLPVLMAYEFMFKPEGHQLWQYLPDLKAKKNLQWAIPLASAVEDFGDDFKAEIIGHLSIDRAFTTQPPTVEKLAETRRFLDVVGDQRSLAFMSSTTQPVEVDTNFLGSVLAELPNHPKVQLRLGLHPGIQDLDSYLQKILAIFTKYPSAASQFKIILPDNLIGRFNKPELSITNPEFQSVFLKVNINGADAAAAAENVTQAVPGALLNQAALEGKPAYIHVGKPYLPGQYFSKDINTFFNAVRRQAPDKKELELTDLSAGECCAAILLK